MKKYVLYNPISGSSFGEKAAKQLDNIYPGECLVYVDMTKLDDYKTFMSELSNDDEIIVCGGDGTLNIFANKIYDLSLPNSIYYYATGSGNDFLRDFDIEKGSKPFKINDYIKNLPIVTVEGKDYRFINGIGFGIDGYCCEKGDELRAKSNKSINYTSIAIKGALFYFKPVNATVTVDGKKHTYKKVWIAPTMHGRFYGGGMMTAPNQKRNNEEGKVSFVAAHNMGKLKILMVFPSIFKGEHINYKNNIEIIEGKNITVEFDRPTALQIDGETHKNILKYTVRSGE